MKETGSAGSFHTACIDLHAYVPFMEKFSASIGIYQSLVAKVSEATGNLEDLRRFQKKLEEKIANLLCDAVDLISKDLASMKKVMTDTFVEIRDNHNLPDLFQADKMDKAQSSAVTNRPRCSSMVATGLRRH